MAADPMNHRVDLLLQLQTWFLSNCDGEREHRHGIRIETLDNPGWLVEIDIARTALKRKPFATIENGIDEDGHPIQSRWLQCSVKAGRWVGAGDGTQLSRLLDLFLDWAKSP